MNVKSINKFVTFHIGEAKFGIPVLSTREIVDHGKITPIPESPDFIEGVINIRGTVVPVVDLTKKFFFFCAKIIETTSIIIVEPDIDGEQTLMGLIVDVVNDVLEIKPEHLEPAPKYGSKLKSEYILNVASIDGEFILILDIDRALSQIEISEDFTSLLAKEKMMADMEKQKNDN